MHIRPIGSSFFVGLGKRVSNSDFGLHLLEQTQYRCEQKTGRPNNVFSQAGSASDEASEQKLDFLK